MAQSIPPYLTRMLTYWQSELDKSTLRTRVARQKLREINAAIAAQTQVSGFKSIKSAIQCSACGAYGSITLTRHGPQCKDCRGAALRAKKTALLDTGA